jgi:Amidohydrolase
MGQKGSVMRRGLQQPRRVMWQLMAGGVLDRHPDLKIALTEIRADWVPATLAHLAIRFSDVHVACKRSPREYWERQFLVTPSSIHRAEVAIREDIGIKQLAFGQDFPHWEGTWPHTLSWLQDAFSELAEGEIHAVLADNAVAFYGLPGNELRVVANRIGPHVQEILGDHTISDELIEHLHHRSGYLRPVDPFYPDEIDVALTNDLSGLAARSS